MAHVVAFGGVAAAAPALVSARKSWPARSPMVALPARRVGVVVAAKKSAPSAPPAPAPVAVVAAGPRQLQLRITESSQWAPDGTMCAVSAMGVSQR